MFNRGRNIIITSLIVVSVIISGITESSPPVNPKTGEKIYQVPSLQQIKPKKPLKIKLKRTAKNEYSWEISGESVEEILKADQMLRKGLDLE